MAYQLITTFATPSFTAGATSVYTGARAGVPHSTQASNILSTSQAPLCTTFPPTKTTSPDGFDQWLNLNSDAPPQPSSVHNPSPSQVPGASSGERAYSGPNSKPAGSEHSNGSFFTNGAYNTFTAGAAHAAEGAGWAVASTVANGVLASLGCLGRYLPSVGWGSKNSWWDTASSYRGAATSYAKDAGSWVGQTASNACGQVAGVANWPAQITSTLEWAASLKDTTKVIGAVVAGTAVLGGGLLAAYHLRGMYGGRTGNDDQASRSDMGK